MLEVFMRFKQSLKPLIFLAALLIMAGPMTRLVRAEVTIEEEEKMGRQFLKAAMRHLKFVEDPEVVGLVNKVGHDVVDHLEVHLFPYRFFVVDSSALNAFAVPGGYVFMNRGLIEIMDGHGELAAILAHEIAHVQSRHIAQRIARAKALNLAALGGMLAGIFMGGEAGSALITGSQAGATSAMLNYSRQDEEESDRRGLRYLEATGYQGEDFVKIMKKMGQDSWKSGGHIPAYLSTHPGVPERVAYLEATVETRPESSQRSGVGLGDAEDFRMMQAKLYGAYEDPREAEVKFREWLGQPETKVMAYYGTGLVQRRLRKMEEAVEFLKIAVSMRPDLAPILVELGKTYYEMGKFDKAISVLTSAITLEPNQPMALFVLGRCLLEEGRVTEARENLATAARLDDRLRSIHYYLGLAYGQLAQLTAAHYHFGIHARRQGNLSNAEFHFQEALRHNDHPELRDTIGKQLETTKKELLEEKKQGGRR
jgi:predicted Zn-dependent protease